jgi:hypothetical protein
MGPVVDRYKARTVFPYVLIPYICGLIVLAWGSHAVMAPLWLFFSGLGFGCSTLTMSVLWAETFGVLSLGAITSIVASAEPGSVWVADRSWRARYRNCYGRHCPDGVRLYFSPVCTGSFKTIGFLDSAIIKRTKPKMIPKELL